MEYQQRSFNLGSCRFLKIGDAKIYNPIKSTNNYPPGPYYNGEVFVKIHDYIPEIIDYYWISNYGRIYSTNSCSYKKIVVDDRNASNNYYIRVALRTTFRKDSRYYFVHRLIMVCFNPNTYNVYQRDMQVNHKDGNKSNNHFNLFNQKESNLEWQSASDNVKHAFRTGLNSQSGEMNSGAKISEEQAIEIISLLDLHQFSDAEIANYIGYDCTPGIVRSIRKREAWTYLTNNHDFSKANTKRIFTDIEVHKFCQYFSNHIVEDQNKTRIQICREALKYYGYDITNEYISELRLVYRKLIYKHITTTYNY